jgi:predicted MFS family arabinose efflux permease
MSTPVSGRGPARVGYAAPLANSEFRGLSIAQVISECGDQVARIALAVLVFNQLHSAFYTALTYAVGYLPLVVGGTLLSPLVDWLPRRQLMLVCHAARAVLVALIALPGVPIGVALALLAGVSLFEAPFSAARASIIPDLLPDGPTYAAAVSLGRALNQVDQAVGFFLGGVVLAFVHPRGALLVDAVGFVVAYLVVLITVRPRPSAAADRVHGLWGDLRTGLAAVFGHPARRALVLIVWLYGLCLILPEGVAVTYARARGGGPISAGVLTAAPAAGLFIGAICLTRWIPARRQTDLMRVLGVGACLTLALTALRPPVAVTAVLWLASGVLQAYWIPAVATFNVSVESELRGRAIAIAGAGLSLTQGIALAGGGALAGAIGPTAAVAWFAVAGLLGLAFLNAWWPRAAVAALADEAFGALPQPDAELAVGALDSAAVEALDAEAPEGFARRD